MSNTITIMCLALDDAVERAFSVDIGKSRTVGHLKDRIRAKKAPYLNDMAADETALYRVHVTVAHPIVFKCHKLEANWNSGVQTLFPTENIIVVFVFTVKPKKQVHILLRNASTIRKHAF
ncbi:hypothetical protein BC938DRAFT_478337 [Jimgerdemannia flammicorona]|uniref:Crinkler effector protein N-terminal domain-containing protein n=1 Tax=Jimgerdemannia flammicorona TaxID=994334 RepID=A0A433QN26_9FUNG|nr:hypothetical protein BC938DRAFT_478337 [Jimgerdemannia flammicorona]